jgi:MATE family multidrug resistance protein
VLVTYMIPVGIASAAMILVGNMIGAKNIEGGKKYAKMCMVTAGIWALGSVALLNFMSTFVIRIFGTADDVNDVILKSFVILSVYVFFDCVQGVCQGVIRGLGKQGTASWVTVTGYWILGIPISLVAVFKFEWGIIGLWLGPTTAIIFNYLLYSLLIVR